MALTPSKKRPKPRKGPGNVPVGVFGAHPDAIARGRAALPPLAAGGTGPVVGAPGPTEPPPDPMAAARAQYQTLLGGATNNANATYSNTVNDSIAGEGDFALDIGATLGSRTGLADSAATQGSINWGGVEANNPFSQAALLVRAYRQQGNRTTNSLAARGQAQSSAMLSQRGEDAFGYQQGRDTLQKGLIRYLAGEARKRKQAGTDRDTTITDAGLSGLGALLGG